MDFLAQKVMVALEKTDMAKTWIYSKGERLTGMSRYQVLEEMNNFDASNTQAICTEIGCTTADMAATLRVLRAIYNM